MIKFAAAMSAVGSVPMHAELRRNSGVFVVCVPTGKEPYGQFPGDMLYPWHMTR